MKNVQVYNYYNTWLKGFDNKIENLILSHLHDVAKKGWSRGRGLLYIFVLYGRPDRMLLRRDGAGSWAIIHICTVPTAR